MQLLRHSDPGQWRPVLVDRTNMHTTQRVGIERTEEPATLGGEEARDKERATGTRLVIHKDKKQAAVGAPDPVRQYRVAGVDGAALVQRKTESCPAQFCRCSCDEVGMLVYYGVGNEQDLASPSAA
jgi:hypothetical protein